MAHTKQRATSTAEAMLSLVVEASPSGMIMTDQAGTIVMVNSATEALFGFTRSELIGQPVHMLIPHVQRAHHPQLLQHYVENPGARPMGHGRDLRGLRKSGEEFAVEVGLNPIHTPQGLMVLASIIDITARKQQEQQLQSALKEKNLLLSEIHHRVKNNLQIIDSLLGMQADNLHHEATVSVLKDCQNRIKSMAMIHQVLYESADFSQVDFAAVAHRLVNSLSVSYALNLSNIAIAMDIEDVQLPIDISIPLGLILNELCTNAMKYAFIDRTRGEMAIGLKQRPENRIELTVTDDGPGLPAGIDLENASTLGLQLVQLLCEQISAQLDIHRSNPTRFTLLIPIPSNMHS